MCNCNRRHFMLMAAAVPFAASGCAPQSEGPEDIRYGREVCVMCGMIISEKLYAAEIRGGPQKTLVKFDDIGDAVNWLDMQPWKEDGLLEFWVMDSEGGEEWLDARTAFYMTGVMSPMDYGFAAVRQQAEGAVDFATMRQAALDKGVTSRCLPIEEQTG